jgi:sialic acid synthase SpsE
MRARRPNVHSLGAIGTTDVQLGYTLVETAGAGGAEGVVLQRGALSERDFKCVLGHAGHVGVAPLGVPRDEADLALLDAMDVSALRLPDADTRPPTLLAVVAQTRRPLILSLWDTEVDVARGVIEACQRAGADSIALLAPTHDMRLQDALAGSASRNGRRWCRAGGACDRDRYRLRTARGGNRP